MFSWEIDNLLKQNNYNINSETYIHICNTSPQITEVKYDGYNNSFEIKTDDSYCWKFKVYKKCD